MERKAKVMASFRDIFGYDARILERKWKNEYVVEYYIEGAPMNKGGWEIHGIFELTPSGFKKALKALIQGIQFNIDNELYDDMGE